jgi:hypothetical protein
METINSNRKRGKILLDKGMVSEFKEIAFSIVEKLPPV